MNFPKIFFLSTLVSLGFHAPGQAGINDTTGKKNSNQQNIIYIIQFQFTENGIGFGAGYERSLDKKNRLSFYLPVMVTFDVANTSRIYNFNTGNYSTGKADAMCYAMPGIKYYAGNQGNIKYATGASFVIGSGQKSSNLLDLNGLNETEQVQSHFITGLMWQNAVNINLSDALCISLELGIGSSLLNRVGNVDTANEFLIQGALKIGYKF